MKLLDVPLGLLINFHELKVTRGISRLILPGANLRKLVEEIQHEQTERTEGKSESLFSLLNQNLCSLCFLLLKSDRGGV